MNTYNKDICNKILNIVDGSGLIDYGDLKYGDKQYGSGMGVDLNRLQKISIKWKYFFI